MHRFRHSVSRLLRDSRGELISELPLLVERNRRSTTDSATRAATREEKNGKHSKEMREAFQHRDPPLSVSSRNRAHAGAAFFECAPHQAPFGRADVVRAVYERVAKVGDIQQTLPVQIHDIAFSLAHGE